MPKMLKVKIDKLVTSPENEARFRRVLASASRKRPFEDAYVDAVTKPKRRSHKNQLDRLTVPELVDAFWKSGVYPTKRGVLELVQRAVKNALERHKRKHGV